MVVCAVHVHDFEQANYSGGGRVAQPLARRSHCRDSSRMLQDGNILYVVLTAPQTSLNHLHVDALLTTVPSQHPAGIDAPYDDSKPLTICTVCAWTDFNNLAPIRYNATSCTVLYAHDLQNSRSHSYQLHAVERLNAREQVLLQTDYAYPLMF